MAAMQPADFILAKRHAREHSREELEEFLGGYLRGETADYQVSAWLMAVCLNGMTDRETADLTLLMADSGDRLDLSHLPHTVDKHSTGGVGDKTSLVISPLLAAAGATVAKMSGRGLGHTGGTVDKLESIPGFRAELSESQFSEQAGRIGVALTGQSRDLAPLDGLLYALRDATGTVQSVPLIASSIMSKKLAGGARSLVLDVKVGAGAFMKTVAEARELAETMIRIGRHAGLEVRAVLSSMEQPLGFEIGNAGEVLEAIACLRGEGPADLEELCITLSAQLLAATGLPAEPSRLLALLHDGSAYRRFREWITAQGGDPDSLTQLELAAGEELLSAGADGVIAAIDAELIGRAAVVLGGGRRNKADVIDSGVGIRLLRRVGDGVKAGEPLLLLRHRDGRGLNAAMELVRQAVRIGREASPVPLVLEVISD